MPRCKECGREITRFDRDICPYCGTLAPIASDYQTEDMTSFFSKVEGDVSSLKKAKHKKTYVLFLFLLGPFGADYFYLGKGKKGVLCLILTLLFYCVLSVAFYFVPPLGWYALLFAFCLIYVAHFIRGIVLLGKDVRDASGETLLS